MADQNKKTNGRTLAGFILVILSPILMVLFMGGFNFIRDGFTQNTVALVFALLIILLPVTGRVFAVIGLIMSIIKREKGKKLAIATIIISELEFIVYFCFIVFWILVAVSGDSRPPVR